MEVDELKQSIQDVFNPIANYFGLKGPIDTAKSNVSFSFAYESSSIGIEVDVEMIQFFIFVSLYCPVDGRLPKTYINSSGTKQRLHLQEALKILAINVDEDTQRLKNLGGKYQNSKEMALIQAQLLQKYWKQISSNTEKLFKP